MVSFSSSIVTLVVFFWSVAAALPVTGTPVCHAPPLASKRERANKITKAETMRARLEFTIASLEEITGAKQARTPGLPRGIADAHDWLPMIQANCRARFTAADFDFVVRTLARSQTDHVSLIDLLGDVETRDSVVDNPRLVEAILSNGCQLQISCHFYFYVLARHFPRDARS